MQNEFLAKIRTFSKEELLGKDSFFDASPAQPLALYDAFAKKGLANWWVAPEFGGMGLSLEESVAIVAELAHGDAGFAFSSAISGLPCHMLALFGNTEFRERVLKEIIKNNQYFATLVTEEKIGSDLLRMETIAKKHGDDYIIDGVKYMSTNTDFATQLFVMCKTPGKGETHNYRAIIVPRNTEGVKILKRWDVVGIRSSGVYEVELKNVKVPVENALIEDGLQVLEVGLNISRILIAATGIGIAQRTRDLCLEYALEKQVKGRALKLNDVFANKLGQFEVMIETIKSVTESAARRFDSFINREDGAQALLKERMHKLAVAAKMMSGQLTTEITTKAATMFGSYGFSSECPMDKLVRDARFISILEGGDEVLSEYVYKSFVLNAESSRGNTPIEDVEVGNVFAKLESLDLAERSDALKEAIRTIARNVMGLAVEKQMDDDAGLFEMGMDSMMAVSFKDKLQAALNNQYTLPSTLIFDYPSINELHEHFSEIIEVPGLREKTERKGETASDDEMLQKLMEELLEKRPVPKAKSSKNKMSIEEVINSDKWVIQQSTQTPPRLRIFCFHFSGGGPSAFKGWREKIPADIDLCLIQLPGREQRRSEPLLTNAEDVMNGILHGITPYTAVPFAFYGHSLGAFLASEAARHCQIRGLPLPRHLIFSCMEHFYATSDASDELPVYDNMNDDELIKDLVERYSGIPDFILNDQGLLRLFLPILRADVSLYQKRVELSEKLKIPITTITCTEDKGFIEKNIVKWANVTEKEYRNTQIPGGHFRILDDPEPFIKILLEVCQSIK